MQHDTAMIRSIIGSDGLNCSGFAIGYLSPKSDGQKSIMHLSDFTLVLITQSGEMNMLTESRQAVLLDADSGEIVVSLNVEGIRSLSNGSLAIILNRAGQNH
tara:strand:- start:2735 stop:3040 length:306 start_codon:yes stop_codon:yes gene_type:complete